jgi:hypothetical protein
MFPHLCKKQRIAHVALYRRWKSHVVGFGCAAPDQGLGIGSTPKHNPLCDISHRIVNHRTAFGAVWPAKSCAAFHW